MLEAHQIIEDLFYLAAEEIPTKNGVILGMNFNKHQPWMFQVIEALIQAGISKEEIKNQRVYVAKTLWQADSHKNATQTRNIISKLWDNTVDIHYRRNDERIALIQEELARVTEDNKKKYEEFQAQKKAERASVIEVPEIKTVGKLMTPEEMKEFEGIPVSWCPDKEFLDELGLTEEFFGVKKDE